MDIKQLSYFLSTVKHGSLKAAAREHFVTQPAVTMQLKKLEEELGEKLYVRRGRRIVATQVGTYVVPYAEEVLQRIEALRTAVHGLKGLERGHLTLGNIDAASIYVLPSVFRSLRRKHPGVEIRVIVADTDHLIRTLESGEIELAIVTLPLSREGLEVVPIYRDDMVLVASPGHRLATERGHRRVLEVVSQTGLITYPADSTTRRLIEQVFLENGLQLRSSMEMSSPEAIKRLTEAGLGLSILPIKAVANEIRRGKLRSLPTGRVKFSRMLGLVHRSGEELSRPAHVFRQMLLEKFGRNIG